MLIVRHGELAFEAQYGRDCESLSADLIAGEPGPWSYRDVNWRSYYHDTKLHTIRFATKSVMFALVGIAISRGEIPETQKTHAKLMLHRDLTDPAKAAITLEDLLTMRTGFVRDVSGRFASIVPELDLVSVFSG